MMALVANVGSMASIALVSSVVISPVALGSSTARLQRVVASTASAIVVTILLLAVLLVCTVSLFLVLVLSQFLILEFYAPVTIEVISQFVRIQNMVRINTAWRKLEWTFVGVALANTPSREYPPFLVVSPAKSLTSHHCF